MSVCEREGNKGEIDRESVCVRERVCVYEREENKKERDSE